MPTSPDTLVAALGLSAVAAWEVLEGRAALRPGETVLVLGAGGVVGQVARAGGAAARRRPRRRRCPLGTSRSSGPPPGRGCRGRPARRRRRRGAGGSAARGLRGPRRRRRRPARRAPRVGRGAGARATADAWSTSAAAPGRPLSVDSAALRSRSAAVLGYTNNSLTDRAPTGGVRHGARPRGRRAARGGPRRSSRWTRRRPPGPPSPRGAPHTGSSSPPDARWGHPRDVRPGRATGPHHVRWPGPVGQAVDLSDAGQLRRVGLAGLRHRDGHRVGPRRAGSPTVLSSYFHSPLTRVAVPVCERRAALRHRHDRRRGRSAPSRRSRCKPTLTGTVEPLAVRRP